MSTCPVYDRRIGVVSYGTPRKPSGVKVAAVRSNAELLDFAHKLPDINKMFDMVFAPSDPLESGAIEAVRRNEFTVFSET
ncbi:hypothetical protein O1W68_18565 [Rhodococcus sp. H36-A4]|uniref:hypothetical protein n=1 Tax=Rhodococcus sp. H36-A4 TaxID=3004353 RepID=UPI0022AE6EEE|nr:hypothetical protein [Rhodococcus sp. H36-A4]MCZ4079953.1 hypothetical protein [Rhodococcus sp. H36-A4]